MNLWNQAHITLLKPTHWATLQKFRTIQLRVRRDLQDLHHHHPQHHLMLGTQPQQLDCKHPQHPWAFPCSHPLLHLGCHQATQEHHLQLMWPTGNQPDGIEITKLSIYHGIIVLWPDCHRGFTPSSSRHNNCMCVSQQILPLPRLSSMLVMLASDDRYWQDKQQCSHRWQA